MRLIFKKSETNKIEAIEISNIVLEGCEVSLHYSLPANGVFSKENARHKRMSIFCKDVNIANKLFQELSESIFCNIEKYITNIEKIENLNIDTGFVEVIYKQE